MLLIRPSLFPKKSALSPFASTCTVLLGASDLESPAPPKFERVILAGAEFPTPEGLADDIFRCGIF